MLFKNKLELDLKETIGVHLAGITLDKEPNENPLNVAFVTTNTGESEYPFKYNSLVLENILEAIDQGLDIITAPEYAFRGKRFYQRLSEKQKDGYLNQIIEASRGKNSLIVPGTFFWEDHLNSFNTCYVIVNGELKSYNKINLTQSDTNTSDGKQIRRPFKTGEKPIKLDWQNYIVGIEICSDYGRLHNRHDTDDLDIHILVARDFQDKIHVRGLKEKGILIYNEGFIKIGGPIKSGILTTY